MRVITNKKRTCFLLLRCLLSTPVPSCCWGLVLMFDTCTAGIPQSPTLFGLSAVLYRRCTKTGSGNNFCSCLIPSCVGHVSLRGSGYLSTLGTRYRSCENTFVLVRHNTHTICVRNIAMYLIKKLFLLVLSLWFRFPLHIDPRKVAQDRG